jgi:hypothetical protein
MPVYRDKRGDRQTEIIAVGGDEIRDVLCCGNLTFPPPFWEIVVLDILASLA